MGRRLEAGIHTFVWVAVHTALFFYFFSLGVELAVPGMVEAEPVLWFTAATAGLSLFLALLRVLYVSPARNGHTLGQWLAGIRPLGPDLGPPRPGAWALRALASLFQAVTLVAAVAWLWLAFRNKSLSDRFSGTFQVREDNTPHWLWKLSPITALALVLLMVQYAGTAVLAVPYWGWHLLGAVSGWLFLVYGWKFFKQIRPSRSR
ncbi:MAG: RDD family protein [Pseudomonadota bacterium]